MYAIMVSSSSGTESPSPLIGSIDMNGALDNNFQPVSPSIDSKMTIAAAAADLCRPLTPNPDDTTSTAHDYPAITTATLPTQRQRQILAQSWSTVSSRQPLGNRDHPPTLDALVDFSATILEMRLADLVKDRIVETASAVTAVNTMTTEVKTSSKKNGGLNSCSHGGGGGGGLVNGVKMGAATSIEEHSSDDDSDDDDAVNVDATRKAKKANDAHPHPEEGSIAPTVLLTSTARSQIRAYVRRIAAMYHDNRYHALEHAVHVTMSANKLLDMLQEGTVESDDDLDNIGMGASGGGTNSSPSSGCGGVNINNKSILEQPQQLLNQKQQQEQKQQKKSHATEVRPRRGMLTKASSYRLPNTNKAMLNNDNATTMQDSHHNNHNNPRTKRHKRSSTYQIYSSTFTKFSFVFAAFIHDVDHQGVPNARLVQENDPIAKLYDNMSVAEKHSIKVAFRTLSEGEFDEFRALVFASPDDQLRMHRIVTNLVISTDIASPERMQSTKVRWEEAFSQEVAPSGPLPFGRLSLSSSPGTAGSGGGGGGGPSSEIATVTASEPRLVSLQDAPPLQKKHTPYPETAPMCSSEQRRTSLKRVLQLNGGQTVEYFTSNTNSTTDTKTALRHSVVIETMLNVADVAHSMQSWELFLFWNRNLYEELYDAFKAGRSANNPAKGWYENQLFFYKIYILPLAGKMQSCGAFGELGGEFVRNAISIRDQWDREGEAVTKEMIASVEKMFQ